ncbi:hypothetical protein [Geomicrobium sp. JCM 19055]|uniref:hypothetical protein n=1 Tax=Geomicrobium sp. JCM 19055 TaxID=1460649 RepID=UPI00045ED6FC|nr:hypothetical protein [Geomicrobium sp. JCM 19055]GAK00001.1 hypothetical protein JCM19055_3066 [Geomicrobium sp. JCM 19055]
MKLQKNERNKHEPSLMMKQQQVEQLLQEQQTFQEIHRKLNEFDLEIKKQAQQVIETTNQKEAIQRTIRDRSSQMTTVEDQLMTLLERESHHQHVRDASEAAMPLIQQRSALTEYEQDVKSERKKSGTKSNNDMMKSSKSGTIVQNGCKRPMSIL